MLALAEVPYWWASLGVGLGVSFLVISFSGRKGPRLVVPSAEALPPQGLREQSLRGQALPAEEEMPWDDLLQLLKAHQERDKTLPKEWEDDSPEDLWQRLVCRLPEARNGTTTEYKTVTE